MSISIIEPVSLAIERTRKVLFEPFEFEKWLTLGFCAFLANLASSSGGSGYSYQGRGGGGGGANANEFFHNAMEWLRENLVVAIAGVTCFLAVGVLFGILLTWLSSRGQFMFLDGVARNRGAVREPWSEFRTEANSLFWFRFWFSLAVLLLMLAVFVTCGMVALPDIRAEQFGPLAIVAIVLVVSMCLAIGIVAGAINIFLLEFVVPIMYLRRCSVREGWREFARVMFADYKGTLLLYLLFQLVLGIAVGILATFAICCTCCLAAIPYIGTVLLLPLYVFTRAYSLYFIEQFGPEWRIFASEAAAPGGPAPGHPYVG